MTREALKQPVHSILDMFLFLSAFTNQQNYVISAVKKGVIFQKTLDESLLHMVFYNNKEKLEANKEFIGKSAFYIAAALNNDLLINYTITFLDRKKDEKSKKDLEFVLSEIEAGNRHFLRKRELQTEDLAASHSGDSVNSASKRLASQNTTEPTTKIEPVSTETFNNSPTRLHK